MTYRSTKCAKNTYCNNSYDIPIHLICYYFYSNERLSVPYKWGGTKQLFDWKRVQYKIYSVIIVLLFIKTSTKAMEGRLKGRYQVLNSVFG